MKKSRGDSDASSHQNICKVCYRFLATLRRYKLTEEEWEKLPKKCEACGSTERLHIDHDHDTGKVRGILCGPCNSALGYLNDRAERVYWLYRYITQKRGM